MEATQGQLKLIRDRIPEPARELTQVAGCDSDAAACQTLVNVPGIEQWFRRKKQARAEYRECIDLAAELERQAHATIAQVDIELEKLHQQRQPLPGTADFKRLEMYVRQLDEPRMKAQEVLEELQVYPLFLADPEAFLRRVDVGARFAAAYLIRREAERIRVMMTGQLQEIVVLVQRDVLSPLGELKRLTAEATQFAGEEVAAPRLVLSPVAEVWQAVANAPAPQLGKVETPPPPESGARSGGRLRRVAAAAVFLALVAPRIGGAVTPTPADTPTPTMTPTAMATAPADACLFSWPVHAKIHSVVLSLSGAGPVLLVPAPVTDKRHYLIGLHYDASDATIVTLSAGGATVDTANLTATVPHALTSYTADQPSCTATDVPISVAQTNGSAVTTIALRYVDAP